jgi:hypothetical protein
VILIPANDNDVLTSSDDFCGITEALIRAIN